MIRNLLSAGIALLLCLLIAGESQATTITMRFDGVALGQATVVDAWSGPDPGSPGSRRRLNTLAGIYGWTKVGGDYAAIDVGESFSTSCIDVSQTMSGGSIYTYTVEEITNAPVPATYSGGTIDAVRADALQKHYARNFGTIGADATLAAAFQIAVWEIVCEHWSDPNYNVGSDSFLLLGNLAVADAANAMLDNLSDPWQPWEDVPELVAFVSTDYQDQMWLVPLGDPPHAPEPITVLGLGMALLGVGCYVRRRGMC
jgi:hypothetical protein